MASNRHALTLHGEDIDTVDALMADTAARAGGPSGAAEYMRKNSKMGISQEYAPAVNTAVALLRKGSMKTAATAVVDDGLSKKQREDMERQKRLREGALKFRAHALGVSIAEMMLMERRKQDEEANQQRKLADVARSAVLGAISNDPTLSKRFDTAKLNEMALSLARKESFRPADAASSTAKVDAASPASYATPASAARTSASPLTTSRRFSAPDTKFMAKAALLETEAAAPYPALQNPTKSFIQPRESSLMSASPALKSPNSFAGSSSIASRDNTALPSPGLKTANSFAGKPNILARDAMSENYYASPQVDSDARGTISHTINAARATVSPGPTEGYAPSPPKDPRPPAEQRAYRRRNSLLADEATTAANRSRARSPPLLREPTPPVDPPLIIPKSSDDVKGSWFSPLVSMFSTKRRASITASSPVGHHPASGTSSAASDAVQQLNSIRAEMGSDPIQALRATVAKVDLGPRTGEAVIAWLIAIELSAYANDLFRLGYDSVGRVLLLDEYTLTRAIPSMPEGHRRHLLHAVQILKTRILESSNPVSLVPTGSLSI